MGYNTRHTLTVVPDVYQDIAKTKIIKQAGFNPVSGDKYSWPDMPDDMEAVSLEIPAIIIIDGEGKDAGDIWRRAWLDGEEIQELNWKLPPITLPEPSPLLLSKVEEVRVKQVKAQREQEIQTLEARLAKLKAKGGLPL